MLSGMAFWLLPVPSAPFPCLRTFVQPFLLRVFRVVMYLSCVQTAVVYLVWCFAVDTSFSLFLLHPWVGVCGVCRWSGVLWHGCKLWLGNCQLKRWHLASVLFWFFPSPFMFCFLLIFYFDILIYKNRYCLLADVCLLSSHFFWMPDEFFCFVFSIFNLEGSSVFLYGFSLCFLCLLCVCVPDGISQSFRSSLVQIHFDVFIFRCFEAENMFLLCLFFFNLWLLRLGGRLVCTGHRLASFYIKIISFK